MSNRFGTGLGKIKIRETTLTGKPILQIVNKNISVFLLSPRLLPNANSGIIRLLERCFSSGQSLCFQVAYLPLAN